MTGHRARLGHQISAEDTRLLFIGSVVMKIS